MEEGYFYAEQHELEIAGSKSSAKKEIQNLRKDTVKEAKGK